VKAFEYSFDSLIHHFAIFVKLIFLIGIPLILLNEIDKNYIMPRMRIAWHSIKNHVIAQDVLKKIEAKATMPSSPEGERFRNFVINTLGLIHGPTSHVPWYPEELAHPTINQVITVVDKPAPEKKALYEVAQKHQAEEIGLGVFVALLLSLLSLALYTVFIIFSTRLTLDFHDFHTIRVDYAVQSVKRLFWLVLGTLLVYKIIVSLGILLFIIPGIFLALRYFFASTLVIDEKATSISHAFGMSALCTDGAKWKLFFFMVCLGAMNVFSLKLPWLHLLIAPISALAYIYVYKKLLSQAAEVPSHGKA